MFLDKLVSTRKISEYVTLKRGKKKKKKNGETGPGVEEGRKYCEKNFRKETWWGTEFLIKAVRKPHQPLCMTSW